MAQRITHTGIIDSISHGCVSVRIMQMAACSSCQAAKLCRSSEQKEKIIEVVTPDANQYKVGQEVTIVGSVSQGLHATLFAYVLPLLLMLVSMVLAASSGSNDAVVAMVGLLVLALYFLLLYLLRGRFERRFAFRIE